MDQGTNFKPIPSNNTPNPSGSAGPTFTPPNPYARDPSRRAIACVTCAKAKTRCDKAVSSPETSYISQLIHSSFHHAPVVLAKASNAIHAPHAAQQTTTTAPSPQKSPSSHPSASQHLAYFPPPRTTLPHAASPLPDPAASCAPPHTSTSAPQSK